MWQSILGVLVGVALAGLLIRKMLATAARSKTWPQRLFADAQRLLDEPEVGVSTTAGTASLTGHYKGRPVQIKVVADTLALRKLPSLWLMVTLPGPVPVSATLDLMMRPEASSSISNFDQLPFTLPTPQDFPVGAVIRTDDPEQAPLSEELAPHLGPFHGRRGKELLITPKGLRMVMLLAEADRARYGVLRQADFGDLQLSPELLSDCLERLRALRSDIENWHNRSS